jgi:hypothetical protein
MKTCLLLSGQIRDAEKWFPSIKKNLLDVYNPDVFISTWSNDPIVENETSILRLIELYNPADIEIENFEEVSDEKLRSLMDKSFRTPPETKPLNVFSMYYKIMKANELKNKFEIENNISYDVVIRCRMDLNFIEQCPVLETTDDILYIPAGWDFYGGCNDLFAIGNKKTMDYYSSVFNNLEKIIHERHWVHPESILKFHLMKADFKIKRPEIRIMFGPNEIWNVAKVH